ncbi:MAG: hypothetical protein ACI3ZC_06545 [Candidatus Cryptobacteroides sp.]
MKNWKKYTACLLALMMCLSMAACEGKDGNEEEVNYDEEVSNDGEISIEDLEGFWYPPEGIGSTSSVLTSIYIDGTAGTWEEYDQYGDPTEYTGIAYTDGTVLTLTDVPLIGDVDIPIGDADTLVTDTGETYWVKGYPDFMDKPELSSSYYGNWYLRGNHDSEYATVLTLNEDGTYSWYGTEGTYTYREFDEYVGDTGTTVFRQEIALSEYMNEMYYLVSDGQVLVRWSDASNGDDYYIHEDALDNVSLLTEYNLTNESFSGQDYSLEFYREYTVSCYFFNGETRTGTWEMDDTTIRIFWDDGETDEAELDWKTLYMSSTGETLENPW